LDTTKVVNTKPVVEYTDVSFLGARAFVEAEDHPNFPGKRFLKTSLILTCDFTTGEFETTNTIYRKKKVTQ
jgi:hypothetical protein